MDASSPPPSSLRILLDGDRIQLRDRILRLLATRPELRPPAHLPLEEGRERVLEALHLLADEGIGSIGYPVELGGEGDPTGALVAFETLAYGDLSVLIKFGVQFGLWGGSVLQLGTRSHHTRWLPGIGSLALPGSYAMSELGHGSNVRELETVATWIGEAGAFEIHSPTPSATKEWIGNAARHGRMATVFARLQIGGTDHGVHAFVVPLRDGEGRVIPGIRIEDCGWKAGLNGVDNGRIRFDRVRIPRDHLLDRFASVDEAGRWSSPIPSEGARFFTMLGTLVGGRISIAGASLAASRVALAIALRFSLDRRQFGPEGGEELPILRYRMQQRQLLLPMASTWALTFALRELAADFERTRGEGEADGEALRRIETVAAGLKAEASRHAIDTVQACREACGGQGYREDFHFARLKADLDIFATFEGANVVLLQLVARSLLSRYRDEIGEGGLRGTIRFLAERAAHRIAETNPVIRRRSDEAHLLDPGFQCDTLQYREDRMTGALARRLHHRIEGGMDPFDALNDCQDHAVALARAHVDRLAIRAIHRAVDRAAPDDRPVVRRMSALFALSRMEAHSGWYQESGVFEGGKARAVRRMVNTLAADAVADVPRLLEAFGIPEEVLRAPAGAPAPLPPSIEAGPGGSGLPRGGVIT